MMGYRERFKIDGKYTKLLKAYGKLFDLQHSVKCKPMFDNVIELEVALFVKNKWYESIADVFEEGKVAYVSSLRTYVHTSNEDEIEIQSRKIIEGTFGDKRYIQSMAGGDCLRILPGGKFEKVPRTEIYNIPRNFEELMIRLDLAGIDYREETIEIGDLK